MSKRKNDTRHAHTGEKNCWHKFGLQSLPATRFTNVVNKILTGRYSLIGNTSNKTTASGNWFIR